MAWTVKDRWGNKIVLTEERWQHIVDGHWELTDLRDRVLDAVRLGTRKQFADDLSKYRYARKFQDLPYGYTHLFVIVKLAQTKFVITAYPKRVR